MQDLLNAVMQNSILSIVTLMIVIIFLWIVDKILQNKIAKFTAKTVRKFLDLFDGHKLDKNVVKLNNSINDDLTVLRSELEADRAYIVQFHNGQVFLSKNPSWKMSMTHEKVKSNIVYRARELQNFEISLFWDDFAKVFYYDLDGIDTPGISVIRKNLICSLKYCVHPKLVYLFDVREMNPNLGPWRTMLEKYNIKYSLVTPIIDSDMNIVGFVGVDYCNLDDIETIQDQEFYPCKLCKFASQLSLAFERNEKGKEKLLSYQRRILEGD